MAVRLAYLMLARAELAHEGAVSGKDPEMAFDSRRFHLVDGLPDHDTRGGHDLELDGVRRLHVNPSGRQAAAIFSAFLITSSIPPAIQKACSGT